MTSVGGVRRGIGLGFPGFRRPDRSHLFLPHGLDQAVFQRLDQAEFATLTINVTWSPTEVVLEEFITTEVAYVF